ncbi:MAG: peptidoglycan DD-metalloendopeptidase family protein [Herminiimonas sp.]|nr:peptidoglycan DD-metalloendopeptidase family protein [Herminiimonas sp.]
MISIDKILPLKTVSALLVGTSRKTRIVSVSALILAAVAFGAAGVAPMAPDAANLPVRSISETLALPDLAAQISALEQQSQEFIREEKIRPGDTLGALLGRLGVDDGAAASFIKSDSTARAVMQLQAGKRVQVQTDADGSLKWLTASIPDSASGSLKNLVVKRDGDYFKAIQTAADMEKRVEMHSGVIRSSLFAATDTAQLPDNVAKQIVDMFATDLDFASDLQRGDRFNVVYETFYQNGEFVRAGRILAGEFTNAGRTYRSVWFDDPATRDGGGYYSFDGKSLKKAFLKSPLEFSRISSGFSMRMHPISGQWKRHEGVDFAAASGTPIRAAGDGVVDFVGGQNGYGNVVVVKHWSNYSTAYAHMSHFGKNLRKGMKVAQGDVIGYVGTTGWSTGPHLHYEFRINNRPHDPLAVDIPNAQPLAGNERQRFQGVASDMLHRFALLSPADVNPKLASR